VAVFVAGVLALPFPVGFVGDSEPVFDFPDPLTLYQFEGGSTANAGTLGAAYDLVDPGGSSTPTLTGGYTSHDGNDYWVIGTDLAFLDTEADVTWCFWAKETTAFRIASAPLAMKGPNLPDGGGASQNGIQNSFIVNTHRPLFRVSTHHHDITGLPWHSTAGDLTINKWRFWLVRGSASDDKAEFFFSSSAGALVNEIQVTDSVNWTEIQVNNRWLIGWNEDFGLGSTSPWIGLIDDVAMWNVRLSDAEVQAFFDSTVGTKGN